MVQTSIFSHITFLTWGHFTHLIFTPILDSCIHFPVGIPFIFFLNDAQLRAIIPFHILWRTQQQAHHICSDDGMPAGDLPVSCSCKTSCASELGMYAQVVPDDFWPSWSLFLTVWSDTCTPESCWRTFSRALAAFLRFFLT